jgi:hypothetical protein
LKYGDDFVGDLRTRLTPLKCKEESLLIVLASIEAVSGLTPMLISRRLSNPKRRALTNTGKMGALRRFSSPNLGS